MKKNTNLCVDLKTILQEDVLMMIGKRYIGGITRDAEDHYLFVEEAPTSSPVHRNPKLYDGKYCSLVHMQNGSYRIYMKNIDAAQVLDCAQLACLIFTDLLKALKKIH